MAKFTPGAIVSEVRNKIAASVFTKNRAGAAVRNRTTPINRRSVGQTQKRQQLSALSSGWRGLTASQITAWNAAAPSFPQQDQLGQTIFLTGHQLYVRLNANLILIGASQITSPPSPTSFAVLALGAISAVASTGVITVAFTPTPVPTGFNLILKMTAPVSAGKSFVGNSAFRYVQNVAPAGTSPVTATSAYATVFGAITSKAGQKIFVKIYLVQATSGLAGIAVRGSVVIS